MAISNIDFNRQALIGQEFGLNVIPRSTERQQFGGTSFGSNNVRQNLFDKLNSLDGNFEKNRINPYSAAQKVTAPAEIGSIHSTEKAQQSTGYANQFANKELSTTDAMALLEQNQDLLNNSINFEGGKTYNLNDGEFHPVYNELLFDEMA